MKQVKNQYDRLMIVARRRTGQSERVAQFLLAWYNIGAWGGWGPHLISYHDREIQADILAVLTDLAANGLWYPDANDMDELIEIYHPDVRGNAVPVEEDKAGERDG